MRLEDVDEIRSLLCELGDHLGEPFDIEAHITRDSAEHMLVRPENYGCFVYEEDSILGFVSICYYRSLLNEVGTALINELVVRETARGRGVGTALIRRAFDEAHARHMDEIEVGAKRDNAGALSFYRGCGFDQEYVLFGRELGLHLR